jgi:isoleucyl-tRNA synthetase
VLAKRPELTWPADLYLEGTDQYRGWFQSSLLVGIGTRDKAPYRAVLTHGFVVDEQGRKMSKSVGNVVSPQQVMKDSGSDVLRLWVSMVDYRDEVRLGKEVLARTVEAYRKIRNSAFKYLISNLFDFDPATDAVETGDLLEIDRFALARYARLARRVLDAYEAYDFQTVFHAVNEFVTVDLSAFYADVCKDRLYTFHAESRERRSAQTVQYLIADGLTRLLAPVLSVTADEVWRHLPGSREASVHLADFPAGTDSWFDEALEDRWNQLLDIRGQVNLLLEAARQKKEIGSNLGAQVIIRASDALRGLLERYEADLPMLLIVSAVSVVPAPAAPGVEVEVRPADGTKCPRCWRVVPETVPAGDTAGLCVRCADAVGDAVAAAR